MFRFVVSFGNLIYTAHTRVESGVKVLHFVNSSLCSFEKGINDRPSPVKFQIISLKWVEIFLDLFLVMRHYSWMKDSSIRTEVKLSLAKHSNNALHSSTTDQHKLPCKTT